MVVLGKYIYYDGQDYYCDLCERWFFSESALEAHCRNTTRHAWCERCERVFRSDVEKNEHLRASSNHLHCVWCDDGHDFSNPHSLYEHQLQVHDRCDVRQEHFKNCGKVVIHISCIKDEDEDEDEDDDDSENDDDDDDGECIGCDRSFASNSAMLVHLEAGACQSQCNLEFIKDKAFQFDQGWDFTNFYDDLLPFYCPECCQDFGRVSSLFQHAESRTECSVSLEPSQSLGKLLSHFSSLFSS